MPRKHTDLAVPTAGPTVSATLTLAPNEFLVGIQVAATFDGTSLTVTGNSDGSSTLVPVKDAFGNAVTITIADDTANFYYLAKEPFLGLTRVAFTSNAAQAAGGGETLRATTWIDD
jgi:hypothetical protein